MTEATSLTEVNLLRQHAEVLFDMDDGGRLIDINEPGGDQAPRLFLARGRTTHRIWFRADIPGPVCDACRRIAESLPAWDGEPTDPTLFQPFRDILDDILDGGKRDDAPSIGPAYRFGKRTAFAPQALPVGALAPDAVPFGAETPELRVIDEGSAHLLERFFPYTREVLGAREPVVGAVVDGWVVSACFSARRRPAASEAGVATAEPYQGRGLATVVVSAWRDAVERAGAQPLYSTSWDNTASRAVARKLGLIVYAETFSLG
jgi:GNAT superfamily N-acetyltransferase